MKPEEIYNAWKIKKKEIDVSPGFGERVMNQIHRHEEQRNTSLFSRENLTALLSYRFAKPALIAGGLAIGICRIIFVIRFSLG
jgi:hypothetical protein